MMMSLSWACLGREGTRYLSFQHCVFHREAGEAWGLWLNFASLPRLPPTPIPPLSSSPPPSPLRLSFWLQHWLCVNALLLSLTRLQPCPHLSPFPHPPPLFRSIRPSVCLAFHSLCLWMRFEESYEPEVHRHLSVFVTLSLGYVRTKNDKSRSATASKKSISVWPSVLLGMKTLWLLTSHKSSCSNI